MPDKCDRNTGVVLYLTVVRCNTFTVVRSNYKTNVVFMFIDNSDSPANCEPSDACLGLYQRGAGKARAKRERGQDCVGLRGREEGQRKRISDFRPSYPQLSLEPLARQSPDIVSS